MRYNNTSTNPLKSEANEQNGTRIKIFDDPLFRGREIAARGCSATLNASSFLTHRKRYLITVFV